MPQLPQLRESLQVSTIVTAPEVPQGSAVPLTSPSGSRQRLRDGLPLPTQRAAPSLHTRKLASQPSMHAEGRATQAPSMQSWSVVHLVAQQPQLCESPTSSSSSLEALSGSEVARPSWLANEGEGPGVRAEVVETVAGAVTQAASRTDRKVRLKFLAVMTLTQQGPCPRELLTRARRAQKTPATRSPSPPLIGESEADIALLLRPGQP